MIIASNPFFHSREEYMLNYWAAYKLDCMILEELRTFLKDFPGFTRYDESYRQDITASCESCYQKGKRLVQNGETLLLRKDTVVQDDFLHGLGCSERTRKVRAEILNKIGNDISGFFFLYDDVMLDAGDFEDMYAAFFVVEGASPSPAFLDLARTVIQPSIQVEANWFPNC